MDRVLVVLLCLLAGAGTAAGAAAGAAVLDQSQEAGIGAFTITEGTIYAQVFTAGVTGTLDSVELKIEGMEITDPSYPTTVAIAEAVGGVPSGAVLGTVSGHVFALGWSAVDFLSEAVMVTAGNQYGILISNVDPDHATEPTLPLRANWEGDVYSGGALWRKSSDVWYYFGAQGEIGVPVGSDLAFRTYVVPIPEPGTLGVLAVMGLGALRRGRK